MPEDQETTPEPKPWWFDDPVMRKLHRGGAIMPTRDPRTVRLPKLRELKGPGPSLTEMLLEDRRKGCT